MDAAAFEPFTTDLNYPMFVLTVGSGGPPSGCLVGFATQCSIAPVRFLVCVSKRNHTFRALDGAEFVGVHRLGEEHRDLAELFGTQTGDEIDKFSRCDWSVGPEGAPILDRCPSWFVGSVDRWMDLGDHVGLLLSPVRVAGAPGEPLMSASIGDLSAGHEAGSP
jgi:flavin reductase (DIM6/NTAB) family NADH-FMN oxidoreductase RutF